MMKAWKRGLGRGEKRRIKHWRRIERASLRTDYRCFYCGLRDKVWTLEHLVPVSMGGNSNPDNLVIACQPCNLRRGNSGEIVHFMRCIDFIDIALDAQRKIKAITTLPRRE